eukprot:4338062-Prorocentrum_lima.AAC.1
MFWKDIECPFWCDPVFSTNEQDVLFQRCQGDQNWLTAGILHCRLDIIVNGHPLVISWGMPPVVPS